MEERWEERHHKESGWGAVLMHHTSEKVLRPKLNFYGVDTKHYVWQKPNTAPHPVRWSMGVRASWCGELETGQVWEREINPEDSTRHLRLGRRITFKQYTDSNHPAKATCKLLFTNSNQSRSNLTEHICKGFWCVELTETWWFFVCMLFFFLIASFRLKSYFCC